VAPDATVVTVTRARTLVPLEQPAATADYITRFWVGLG
jgi:hypothetical protein